MTAKQQSKSTIEKLLPTLYKRASTGKIQEWTIGTLGNTIVTRWGQKDGKIQETRDVIASGKNLGKANVTTPEQQAESEAKSTWEKKLKSGYCTTADDASAGKTDAVIEGGVWPMLAHRYDKHGDKILWPCYVQPKFDGHRCIATVDADGVCTLWSRSRKRINTLPHIVKSIEALGFKNVVLDGELYNHKFRDDFEQITKFIKRDSPLAGHEIVQYHLYDMPSDKDYEQRYIALKSVLAKAEPCLVLVTTTEVKDQDEAIAAFESCIAAGYEGAMLRNKSGAYIHHPTKRSYDLQKIKEFDDAEFEIVGVIEGRGKLAGHGIFVCKTSDGVNFEVKMKGDTSALKAYLYKPSSYIGQNVTVQFQGYTNKSKVPRFPVGLRLRNDI